LAEVDEQELVKEVQEFYGDYLAINPDIFSLNISYPSRPLYGDSANLWDGHAFQRALEGVVAVLLSLKKRPLIRYERNSAMAKRLASEIHASVFIRIIYLIYNFAYTCYNVVSNTTRNPAV
jgi:hypothetical protein